MSPKAYVSTLSLYRRLAAKTSGAMYSGVPTAVMVAEASLKRLRPKSLLAAVKRGA